MKKMNKNVSNNKKKHANSKDPYCKQQTSKPAQTELNFKGLLDFHKEEHDTKKILKAINEYVKKEM